MRGYRSLGWRRHLAALALLSLVLIARFSGAIFSAELRGDELPVVAAVERLESGASPYGRPGFLYPPTAARLAAALTHIYPARPLLPQRLLSLAGLVVLTWGAAAWLAGSFRARLLTALVFLLVAPGVRQGIELGNVSFLAGGLLLVALVLAARRPLVAGGLLGLGLLVKPLAPGAVVALAASGAPARRSHRAAALVACLAAAGPIVADPLLPDFLARSRDTLAHPRTVSVFRFLALADRSALAPWLALALLALVAWLAWRFVGDETSLVALATAAAVSASPVVWNHTLVLTLPLQAMAWTLAAGRWRDASAAARRRRGYELAGVVLAIVALAFGEGATGIDDRGLALQIVGTLPIAAAPIALLAYVLGATRRRA